MASYPLRAAFAGILLFVVGLGIAGGVWLTNAQEQERLTGWRRADGTVVEILKRHTADGEIPVPLVAFTTASGERVSFTMAAVPSTPYYVNNAVTVLYHPNHPQDAFIDTSPRRWIRNALAGAAALILMCLGAYVAWYASRWQEPAPRSDVP